MTYAFYFDSSFCTGCKACQVACKDKNNLPLGVLWRRVYEISGGGWEQHGEAWVADVFAYHLSIACNHCEHPICAGVCPTQAYSKREDGLVLLDTAKCLGCQYCAWACPYGAPQYNAEAGHMTKCNFCEDNLEAGLPPACVAACPMRTLDFGQRADLEARPDVLQAVYPMSQVESRNPNILIKPHRAAEQAIQEGAEIANREEVAPRRVHWLDEAPLIAFTLLAQMAIGAFWTVVLILSGLKDRSFGEQISFTTMLAVGILIFMALAVSLFHLGTPKNSWRVLSHLRKSWLSREILSTLSFAGLWLLILFLWKQHDGDIVYSSTALFLHVLVVITALAGAASIYCMARVYRLKTVPAWSGWRTMAGFFITALLLGQSLALLFLTGAKGLASSSAWTSGSMLVLLATEGAMEASVRRKTYLTANRLRLGLIGLGMLGAAIKPILPVRAEAWMSVPIFLILLIEEIIGRWLFYEARHQVQQIISEKLK